MATSTKSRSSSTRKRSSSAGKSSTNGSTTQRNTRAANDNVEAAADRIREINERIIASGKKAGNTYLDIYEKTLSTIADYQEKVGEQSQVDWVTTVANAQANFTRD